MKNSIQSAKPFLRSQRKLPWQLVGRADTEKILLSTPEIRRTAEAAFTVFADSASRAQRNRYILKYLKFASLKFDVAGMRYEFMREIAELNADGQAKGNGKNNRAVWGDVPDISATNGRLQDLRAYMTRLTELYWKLLLSENLPTWLPNILQLYQRNSDLWQAKIEQLDEIRVNV